MTTSSHENGSRGMAGAVPILMYHSIARDATPGFRRFAIAPDRFSEQMDYLKTGGYRG